MESVLLSVNYLCSVSRLGLGLKTNIGSSHRANNLSGENLLRLITIVRSELVTIVCLQH